MGFLDGIRTVWLALATVAAALLGTVVLTIAVGLDVGGSVFVALGALLLGGGNALGWFTVLLVLRREHDTGQKVARDLASLRRRVRSGPRGAGIDPAVLEEALTEHREALVRQVDARILGLFELLTEDEERS